MVAPFDQAIDVPRVEPDRTRPEGVLLSHGGQSSGSLRSALKSGGR